MRKGKLYISILLGLCLCLFTAFFTACGKEETPPAPTLESISVSGETEVFIDEFDYADYTITVTYSDDSTKTATLTADNLSAEDNAKLSTVGTHALTVSYESVTCSWTVTLKNHDFAGLIFDDVTTTYDGTAKTLAVAGLPTGAQVSYDKATSYTNAGEYTVKATITLANYNPVELSATLTINKATYDMSAVVFADKTVTYNGQAHSIEATNLPNGVTAQYTGNNKINAGEYEITATFTGDSQNYELIANQTATLTIEQRELTLAFDGETTLKYNGNSQKTITAQATNLVDGDSVELTVSYNGAMIEAGEYTATATLTANQNYKLTANNTVKVTITRATHTVTFKQDGFADIVKEVPDLADLTDIPTPQHVDGYKFTWNRTDFTSITEDITVKAQKDLLTYKIEYVVYDGTNNTSNPTTYTVESATFTLKNPMPSETFGKSFGGWFTSPDFTAENKITKIEKGSFGDLKLYAYWLEYRVTDVVGGTVDYSQSTPEITIKADYGTANLSVKDLIAVSDGCTWKLYTGFECLPTQEITAKRLTVSNIGDNIFYILVFHPDSDEYYTDYVLNVYQLDMKAYTFVKDGETWASGEMQEESALKAPENPEKTGYTFNGWKVNGEFISFPYTILTDTEFVADYTPITYNVSYELNGGENDDNNPKTYNIEQAYTLKNPTRTGYDFKGWFTEETFDNQVTGFAFGSHGDKKFYAKWTPIVYTIAYELDGGENDENNPETYNIEQAYVLKKPTRTAYTFAGWFTEKTFDNQVTEIALGSYGDKKFYAKWTPTVYTITYELNGGVNNTENPATYTIETETITFANPTKTGYMFGGWFKEETLDTQVTEIALGSHGDKKFYAKWTANLNTLKFDGNGATDGKMSEMKIYTDEKVTLTTNGFLKNYYHFVGWALTPNGEVEYADGAEYTMGTDSEYILYAVWEDGTDGIEYSRYSGFDSGYYIVRGYSGTEINVKIPSVYNGLPVKHIDSSAFWSCSSLNSVVIGNGVTSIGSSAFSGCSSLTSIEIPNSVTSIGSRAFELCRYLTSIEIPDSVTSIGFAAFEHCSSLTSIEIPNGVTSIGSSAFCYCSNLTSIEIPDSVTSIGDNAFRNCSSLTSITIPDRVTTIGKYAFYGNSLTEIVIPDSVTSIGNNAFEYCRGLTSVVIGNSVTSIGDNAFSHCSNLTSITIPDSVTSIGDNAFSHCSNLTSITIPDSVTSIGEWAFSGCSNLTSIKIPDGVTSIGYRAFDGCSSLTSVVIGDSVTSIGNNAFENCRSLTSITVSENNTTYESIDGNLYNKDGTELIKYAIGKTATAFTVPDSVTSIGYRAFSNCKSLMSVVIGNSVTSIGNNAFEYCRSLTRLTIPDTVTFIGSFAFSYCSSLKSIEIPDSVTSIGDYAFEYCSSLTSITIPDTVTFIGSFAFSYCSSLTIYCEATSKPSGWNSSWNYSNCPVYWYSETQKLWCWHYVDGVVTKW